jgi:hypothetical protein
VIQAWLLRSINPCAFSLLSQQLPSEKDSPETLRAKMGSGNPSAATVPVPTLNSKFGKKVAEVQSNPFGFAEDDQDHYW